ncbi:MAG TPA: DNA polymerase III subunit delta' [Alphaproteobacteria bacterium]|nr:DNA polymerase III subunit delta' [Alphaproteobacteria bacterium]
MTDVSLKSPEEQSELFGHEAAEQLFLQAIENNTIDGSWLICGPKGVGKATLAFRLARFLLSEESGGLFGGKPASLAISETDAVFKAVAQRSSPALKVIECALKPDEVKARQKLLENGETLDAAVEKERKRFSEIRIDDIREAEAFMHLTAGAGKKRVLIIDAADDMNVHAANALLKSLEEPPPETAILLLSHAPGKLLPTIRSRCRKVVLKPLENNMLDEFLKAYCPHLTEGERHALTLLAEGSAGKALTLAGSDGIGLFIGVMDLFANFPRISVPKLYDMADRIYKDKKRFQLLQDLFIQWLTRVCVLSQTDGSFNEIIPGEADIIRKICRFVPTLTLMDMLGGITAAFADIDLDRKQVFVNAVLKLQRGANA